MIVFILLITLHVTAAAVLFGAPLGIVGSCRRALATGIPEVLRQAAFDAERRGMLAGICGPLTLLSGLGLIFVRGGFAVVTPNFHAALGLMILAVGFSFAWMKPSTTRLVAAAQADPVDRPAAEKALGRLAMGMGILHLAWLAMLVLMFVRT